MLAVVASQPHKLEVGGSNPPPATTNNWYMEDNKTYRVMLAIVAKNMREIVTKANKLGIQREDIVSILPEGDQFVLTYYR